MSISLLVFGAVLSANPAIDESKVVDLDQPRQPHHLSLCYARARVNRGS